MLRDSRLTVIQVCLIAFAAALVLRAGRVQILDHATWAKRATRQQVKADSVPAPRGAILDASGYTLAESRPLVRLHVAPREVKDKRAMANALLAAGVSREDVARATNAKLKWVDIRGAYRSSDVESLLRMSGVYFDDTSERQYVSSVGARRIVGRASSSAGGYDGVEGALDSLLRGQPGRRQSLQAPRGGRLATSPELESTEPTPGHSVVLTINNTLQEIADRELGVAVANMQADGGDIVMVDPRTGEVRAMASSRREGTALTALSEPYEPGSTIKPLVAGTLLALGRAKPDEVIETFNGSYLAPGRRKPIRDVHGAPRMTLSEVIRESSNVGIVRFAERLTPREQFESMRDFGFGTPSGITGTSEAAGTVPNPNNRNVWSKPTGSSLAMGYAIAVTPLQLAMAYAAIANGGELLSPSLVKEIRAPDGTVVYRNQRRVVRRVLPEEVTRTLRGMLADVVREGTAVDADLETIQTGGKTGTTRIAGREGYEGGKYFASFVGLFPLEDPQLVILVKLDNPRGAYYGGKTAAPISKVVLQAAMAAHDAALDPSRLRHRKAEPQIASASARDTSRPTPAPVVAAEEEVAPESEDSGSVPFVITLGEEPRLEAEQARGRVVPDVRGLPLREQVKVLHEAGFRVALSRGPEGSTSPAAGSIARTGTTVRLFQPR